MSGFGEAAAAARTERLVDIARRFSSVTTDEEALLFLDEVRSSSSSELRAFWRSAVATERERPGSAIKHMAPPQAPTHLAFAFVQALAAFAKDHNNLQLFEEWLALPAQPGDYFTGLDYQTAQQQGTPDVAGISLPLTPAYNAFIRAGGAARVWQMLGLNPQMLNAGEAPITIAELGGGEREIAKPADRTLHNAAQQAKELSQP